MSGGSINYAYSKLDDAIVTIRDRANTPLQRAFADHLDKVSKALHDLEWEWSCDYGLGDSDAAIRQVVGQCAEIERTMNDARTIIADLDAAVKRLEAKAPELGGGAA